MSDQPFEQHPASSHERVRRPKEFPSSADPNLKGIGLATAAMVALCMAGCRGETNVKQRPAEIRVESIGMGSEQKTLDSKTTTPVYLNSYFSKDLSSGADLLTEEIKRGIRTMLISQYNLRELFPSINEDNFILLNLTKSSNTAINNGKVFCSMGATRFSIDLNTKQISISPAPKPAASSPAPKPAASSPAPSLTGNLPYG